MRDWVSFANIVLGVVLGGIATWLIGQLQLRVLIRTIRDAFRNKMRISLGEQLLMTRIIADMVRHEFGLPDVIFAISPGGGMVAEWLARRFLGTVQKPIPVRTINVTHTFTNHGRKAKIGKENECLLGDKARELKVLLVNDTSRSRATFSLAYDFLAEYYGEERVADAALICHEDSLHKPRFSVVTTDKVPLFDWKSEG